MRMNYRLFTYICFVLKIKGFFFCPWYFKMLDLSMILVILVKLLNYAKVETYYLTYILPCYKALCFKLHESQRPLDPSINFYSKFVGFFLT